MPSFNEDIWKAGAADVLGISIEAVLPAQRQAFKQAFYNCLYAYLYGADDVDSLTLKIMINIFRKAAKECRTLQQAKQDIMDIIPSEMK